MLRRHFCSESESSGELQPARGLLADRAAEEWRNAITDVIRIIDVIQKIECVDRNRKRRCDFIAWPGESEIAEPAEVVLGITRSLQCIPAHSGGPSGCRAYMIIITSCRETGRAAGIQEYANAQIEKVSRFDRSQQIEAATLIESR